MAAPLPEQQGNVGMADEYPPRVRLPEHVPRLVHVQNLRPLGARRDVREENAATTNLI